MSRWIFINLPCPLIYVGGFFTSILRQRKLIDGIMKKMKCQHNQIWLTTRLAKLSYYVDGIVRLLIYGVKMSFPKRNLNNVLFILVILLIIRWIGSKKLSV